MNISDVNFLSVRRKAKKRLGRGTGSGLGKTAGRGHKGQGSRAGFSMNPLFEGGQMPLVRRVPKRGFNNPFAKKVSTINVGDLELIFEAEETVNPAILVESQIIKEQFDCLKILGDGDLTKKLTVQAHAFSAAAKEKIEKAGGEVIFLPGKKPVVRNKMGTRKKQFENKK
ncbi:MAG: 50S ribosomal protein L15 [Planctomycetaceae bacterium]|jgi:large subunit ribosomal protein L15|nr:50S ribosomal protein L15 [Planctomycetaceae bacterium]